MAVSAKSFLIALAIDVAIGLVCFLAFCVLRKMQAWRRFYAPKRFLKDITRPRPLGWNNMFSWVGKVIGYEEDDVLAVAGWDAVVYLRILRFGAILFGFLTFWTWAVVLPTNIVGGTYIDQLTADPIEVTSQYTFWVPSPPPPAAPGAPPAPPDKEPEVPEFYNTDVPAAPAGLKWKQYAPGVPPLPTVASALGAAFASYVWEYDSTYSTSNSFVFSNLDEASIANIPPKSALLVVHVISAWVMSLFTWMLLWAYAKKSVALRVRYFLTLPKGAASHTVLVQDIPGVAFGTPIQRISSAAPKAVGDKVVASVGKSTAAAGSKMSSIKKTKGSEGAPSILDQKNLFHAWGDAEGILESKSMAQMVEDEYEDLFPGEVAAVEAVHDTTNLEARTQDYTKLREKLWDLIAEYTKKKREGKKIKRSEVRVFGALLGDWGKEKYGLKPVKRDALEYWPDYLEHLKELVKEEQAKALTTNVPCAFVTFRSRRAASTAASTMINHDLSIYTTSAAPPPETLFWDNLRWRQWERSGRSTLIWVAFWALAFFFLIPVGAVQAMVNVDLLGKIPPFKQLLDIAFTNAIIVSILPGLVLTIFLALVPMILTFMNKRAGMQSLAEIDFGVFQKFFLFQIIVVFFGTFIVGSFFSQFNQWIDDPSSAVNLLGTAIPQTASFFLTYMAVLAFISTPFSGLKIVGLIIYWIKGKIAATENARARLWQDQFAQYGADVAYITLAILLGLVYCIIQPVIAPLVLAFCLISLFFAKYNAIYVKRPAYESGGKFWPTVHGQVMTGLILAQLVVTFVLAIKKVAWGAIITFLTVLVSFIFHHVVAKRFFPPQEMMSYRGATDGDNADRELIGQEEPNSEQYLNPVFTFDEENHQAVLREAANIDLVLKGERGDDALIVLAPEEDDDEAMDMSLATGGPASTAATQ